MGRSVAPLSRRGQVLVLALVLCVAGGLAAIWSRTNGDPAAEPRTGLLLSYDVEDLSTGTRTVETVGLDRPLGSNRISGEVGSATTADGVYDRAGGSWRQLAVVPPGEPGQDQRLTAPLAWASRNGVAAPDGTGSFAGRSCSWWLTREPLDAGPFAAATTADRARTCVDEDGLLLADTWRAGGRDLRRRTATRVSSARVAVLGGATPAPIPDALRVLAVERVPLPPDDLVALAPPRGLVLAAAAKVVEVDPGTATATRRYTRAVYASAADVLVVDQVRGAQEVRGAPMALGALGEGQVQATAGGLVLAVRVGPEQVLTVRTSLPFAEVTAWLAGLQRPAR